MSGISPLNAYDFISLLYSDMKKKISYKRYFLSDKSDLVVSYVQANKFLKLLSILLVKMFDIRDWGQSTTQAVHWLVKFLHADTMSNHTPKD